MEDGDEHPYALLWSMVDFTFTFTHTHNWLVMVAGRVSSQNIPVSVHCANLRINVARLVAQQCRDAVPARLGDGHLQRRVMLVILHVDIGAGADQHFHRFDAVATRTHAHISQSVRFGVVCRCLTALLAQTC